ncbi:Esterase OVCA2 [Schistosoma japonicum]|uniref:Esterase OVCA2 n=1 Tax=Schistosoma japonicum TaxID=6182 RepID=Q5DHW6_SCHJA|nr:SJCHGC09257 protein [Schistosoma japonicum]KAH8872117.1 Esterase C25G4.2 [Schistosoma japonicum]KAH8872118.1 Esterase C25G4.2 [Schistosoma japonicum]KAH8872119.1 Esterase C25G4.2 [Schistosoma japonicum]KAH8872120.1 Esterase C25G4.2 [Schistosoma japonicum]
MTRLKVLCLHGYRQNSDVFREKTGGFRKLLKKFCEFDFISAPNVTDHASNGHAWWFSKPMDFSAQENSDYDSGFRESLAFVKKYIEEEGPFDGAIGFSQGAAFLLMLQIIMEHKLYDFSDNSQDPIKFTILVAPFISRCSLHQFIYAHKTSIPSLIICGETDLVIPKKMSEETLHVFSSEPKLFIHDGGHYIPTFAAAKQIYTDVVSQFAEK